MDEIVYNFSKYDATNALHAQFATDTLNKVPKEVAEAQGFGKQREKFATHVNAELASFKPDKAYFDTEEVATRDKGRDRPLTFYGALARVYADYALDEDQKEAGKTIRFAFDQAGDMTLLPYADETSTITQFTKKLRQEPYLSALPKIHMEDAPDVIDAANDEFNEIYLKRSEENRDRAFAVPMKTLRKNTDEAFNEMAKAINALYAVNEMVTNDESKREALQQIIDDVNAIVVRFRMNMNGSATDKNEDKEEVDTPEEPTEPTDPEGGETTDPSEGEEEEGTGAIPHP